MISSIKWVSRGKASKTPHRVEISDDDYNRISSLINTNLSLANGDAGKGTETPLGSDDTALNGLEIYNLDKYDDDDDDENTDANIFTNIKGLTYYSPEENDPYITLKDEDEEKEEMQIDESDNLILACKTEDEVSCLEVYVYENEEDNLYVHHDIMLPSFPLCLEWMDFTLGKKAETGQKTGNYVAVGTFDPQVEIWDLDVLQTIFNILGYRPCISGSYTRANSGTVSFRELEKEEEKRPVPCCETNTAGATYRRSNVHFLEPSAKKFDCDWVSGYNDQAVGCTAP